MTFSTQINEFAERVGTECKTLHDNIGTLSELTTTEKASLVEALNEIQGKVGTGSAGDITYGEYDYDTVKEALDALLYKAPVINTFTSSVTQAEMGSTVDSATLSWSLNKTPASLTLDGSAVDVSSTSKALTGLGVTANKTWTLKMTDEKNASASKSVTLSFLNGVYYGVSSVSDAASVDSELVLGFTKNLASSKAKTFTVNAGAGQYIFYCVPKRFGTVSFNVGGFDGGFTLLTTLSFTNASGYTEDYYVYKSDNASLGSTTVTCK